MTVRDIIKKYLEENGFDGLFNPGECGCEVNDLMPCGCENLSCCEPGHKHPGDGDYDFYIKPTKI